MRVFLVVLFLVTFGMNVQTHAQETQIKYVVVTKEGNRFVGLLNSNLDNQIVLDTDEFGRLFFQTKNLKDHFPYDENKLMQSEEEGNGRNHTSSAQYFFLQSAFPIKKGDVLYQNNLVFINQIHVGVTDRLSATGGLLFAGEVAFWVNAKYAIPIKDQVNLSVGSLLFVMPGESRAVGLAYGKAAFGSKEKHFSAGLAFGHVGGDFGNTPVILIDGITPISSSFYFMAESYIFPVDGLQAIWALGFRKNFKKWTFDFGAMGINLNTDYIGALPTLGVKVPF